MLGKYIPGTYLVALFFFGVFFFFIVVWMNGRGSFLLALTGGMCDSFLV